MSPRFLIPPVHPRCESHLCFLGCQRQQLVDFRPVLGGNRVLRVPGLRPGKVGGAAVIEFDLVRIAGLLVEHLDQTFRTGLEEEPKALKPSVKSAGMSNVLGN